MILNKKIEGIIYNIDEITNSLFIKNSYGEIIGEFPVFYLVSEYNLVINNIIYAFYLDESEMIYEIREVKVIKPLEKEIELI